MFYWLRVEPFLRSRVIFGGNTIALELPEREAQDIDSEDDWAEAELKYRLAHPMEGGACRPGRPA
jgi:N-acylneuraminate cytidylyltransferase